MPVDRVRTCVARVLKFAAGREAHAQDEARLMCCGPRGEVSSPHGCSKEVHLVPTRDALSLYRPAAGYLLATPRLTRLFELVSVPELDGVHRSSSTRSVQQPRFYPPGFVPNQLESTVQVLSGGVAT